ncbi:MAG TPA: hypothetical protein VLX68_00660 [Chitinivibrionales bacterium]|nr:hypothetical protein [Chitinivibrionales bacterium]
MKENDARVDYDEHQVLLYVEKADGSYGPLQTGAYLTKNYVDDFFQKRQNIETECTGRLRKGDISPVVYYMLLYNMTPADIAMRVGISKGKVIKHQTPAGFAKAPVEVVKRYADVFGVSVANMFQLIVPKEKNLTVTSRKTANPYLSVLEIGRGNQ